MTLFLYVCSPRTLAYELVNRHDFRINTTNKYQAVCNHWRVSGGMQVPLHVWMSRLVRWCRHRGTPASRCHARITAAATSVWCVERKPTSLQPFMLVDNIWRKAQICQRYHLSAPPNYQPVYRHLSTPSTCVYLLWFIAGPPPLFFPGPQLCRRRGERERRLLRKRQRRGTSATLSLASSSASPATPPPPSVAATEAPGGRPSSGLQPLLPRPWLPSGLELDGPTLAVSSVEEQEMDTSLVLSPHVTRSSFCNNWGEMTVILFLWNDLFCFCVIIISKYYSVILMTTSKHAYPSKPRLLEQSYVCKILYNIWGNFIEFFS